MDRVTKRLAELVSLPSVNPMGQPSAGPEFLEGRVTDYLEAFFRELGVKYQREEVAPGRENIMAIWEAPGSSASSPLLVWDAHQDTVPVQGMTIPPFDPRIDGDRLYGRGSCDIKGGMAAMLEAFARLVKERPRGAHSVLMACTADEEFTHLGSSRLAQSDYLRRASLAIVAEPTELDVVTCHKGAVRWKVRTSGVACHSSSPEKGRNAIYSMARVIQTLEEHAADLQRGPRDPELGPATLSVGRIEGGTGVNVVPDLCAIEIDRRVIPGEDPDAVTGQVDAILREKLGDLISFETEPAWVRMPALKASVPPEIMDRILQAVARAKGSTPKVCGVPYGTDAGPLGETGLPCIVLGPGNIAQAHTRDEWIDLDQVRSAVEAYYELARELGVGSGA